MNSHKRSPGKEVSLEKRMHRRCKPEIDAFVSFKNDGVPWMCTILDISLGGLSFVCTPCGNLLFDLTKLSIVIPKPVFYLEDIPFQLISHFEMDTGSANGFSTRRCSVVFTGLNQDQNRSLKCLIETLLALPWGFSLVDQNASFQRLRAGGLESAFCSC
jgi:hypothetical protein